MIVNRIRKTRFPRRGGARPGIPAGGVDHSAGSVRVATVQANVAKHIVQYYVFESSNAVLVISNLVLFTRVGTLKTIEISEKKFFFTKVRIILRIFRGNVRALNLRYTKNRLQVFTVKRSLM